MAQKFGLREAQGGPCGSEAQREGPASWGQRGRPAGEARPAEAVPGPQPGVLVCRATCSQVVPFDPSPLAERRLPKSRSFVPPRPPAAQPSVMGALRPQRD